jgi:hypothetical protein
MISLLSKYLQPIDERVPCLKWKWPILKETPSPIRRGVEVLTFHSGSSYCAILGALPEDCSVDIPYKLLMSTISCSRHSSPNGEDLEAM